MPSPWRTHDEVPPEESAGTTDMAPVGVGVGVDDGVGEAFSDDSTDGAEDTVAVGVDDPVGEEPWQAVKRRTVASVAAARLDREMVVGRTVTCLPSSLGDFLGRPAGWSQA